MKRLTLCTKNPQSGNEQPLAHERDDPDEGESGPPPMLDDSSKSSFQDDDNGSILGTVNIVLLAAVLGVAAYFAYWFYGDIQDEGGWESWWENAGANIWGAIAGAASGFFGGAWKSGKDWGQKSWDFFGETWNNWFG